MLQSLRLLVGLLVVVGRRLPLVVVGLLVVDSMVEPVD
jgi:hypothetical protein